MSFAKKVIVAVGLTDSVASTDGMEDLKEMSFLKDCEIHFVHVFETINYSAIFGEFTAVYPVENERDLIEKSVIVTLTKSSKSLLPKDFSGKIYYKCLFGENQKLKFSEYVEQSEADLVIVHTRKKRGLFESSFAQYVNGHTNVSMIFLKNR